ncbi:MAG TPA: trypsin-like peptidase domain-containing protein [Blastocatellia bacterium]|nr:trypsin-like peptidase domain-containing protein [Blastocatellia bacterium]
MDKNDNIIGQGSGFIVTPLGAIVTNYHVVQGATTARVKLPSGESYRTADVVNVDYAKDIVVLKVNGPQLPSARVGNSDRVDIGEPVVAISSPEGLTNSISTGVISGLRRLETHYVFQITAPISQGSSGGALFDSSGAIIGIVTYLFKSGQNINFAVPINYARELISNQSTSILAELQPPPTANAGSEPPPKLTNNREAGDPIDDQISTAARGRLGLTELSPMFARPLEAFAFLNRMVEGVGMYRRQDVDDLTRTASLVKTRETDMIEEYTIKFVSASNGIIFTFGKTDRLLIGVELLVNWTVADLKNMYGNSYRKKKVNEQTVLDYGKVRGNKYLVAELDATGNVRSVKITKAK